MIKLNLTVMNKLVNGVSKEPQRYWLNGIHVYDKDGGRYYEATDGHICFRAVTPIEDDALGGDYIIKMQSPIKSKLSTCELVIADSDTAVIKCDVKQAFDIIDGNYPDIDRIMPKNREFAKEYTAFAPAYLEKLEKCYGGMEVLSMRPIQESSSSCACWEWEDNDVKYTAILMPLRILEPENE